MSIQELPIPPAVFTDSNARELVRVWAAGGKQHLSLASETWEDPACWGIMLVDLARHLTRAYEQLHGLAPDHVLARIRAGMEAEWEHDTDPDHLGGLLSE
jgi:hypothetical protein